jgi:hypothetical protein
VVAAGRENRPVLWSGLFGAGVGGSLSLLCGLVYVSVLHEPGSAFYEFAVLVFVAGPLMGGGVAAAREQHHKLRAYLAAGGAVFGATFLLFILTYGVDIQFDRSSVRLPESCSGFDGSFDPPPGLRYTLPGGATGLRLAADGVSAVVVLPDYSRQPPATWVLLVDTQAKTILQGMSFPSDVVSASIADGFAYVFNDKLGFLIDSRTGQFEDTFLTIDNYGGLSQSDRPLVSRASSGAWFMETTGVISSWHLDGTVVSRPHPIFNGIARGCYIDGNTGEVTRYWEVSPAKSPLIRSRPP